MLNYNAIEIFTSEEAHHQRRPVSDAIMQYIRELKIAARCIVTRGIAGSYENGELSTKHLEILSFNLPIRIYIILPASETERVLSGLDEIVTEGIVALHDLNVLSHRTRNAFFTRHLMVKDIMTQNPVSVKPDTPLNDAVRLLLSSIFSGLPVVDEKNYPVGVITQGDLIRKGGLPVRLGLLSESDRNSLDSILDRMSRRKSSEVMTQPAVTITMDSPLPEAVELMLKNGLKRLPVVDDSCSLTGMLSRLDIFRTVMREAPDWNAFKAQKIEVKNLKYVEDILRRDVHTVFPETPLNEVIQVIDTNDVQRVAVVDNDGKLLGLISDRDLMRYFKPMQTDLWDFLAKVKHPFRHDSCSGNDLQKCLAETTAGDVMIREIITVKEDMLIGDAIEIMLRQALKRLPVIDPEGRFKGMISRDSLLRSGFKDHV